MLVSSITRICARGMVAAALGLAASAGAVAAPVAVATYDFSGSSLAAAQSGVTSLVAIDPLGQNAFITDTVFGVNKTVYRFDGNANISTQQAGLSLNTTGLLTGKAYSVDMIFSFDSNGPSWERILDASNRTSDNGFYVDPSGKLQVFPVASGPTLFTFGDYHRITLTNNGAGRVTAYFDGIFQFDLTTTVMDFDVYGGNPNDLLTFFADNTSGPAQTEFVDGKVSLIRLYNGELTAGEVGDLPTGPSASGVPLPGTLALVLAGLAASSAVRRRQHAA